MAIARRHHPPTMKSILFSFLSLLAFVSPNLTAQEATSISGRVLENILDIKVLGKVDWVMWSVTKHDCVLQVAFRPVLNDEPRPPAIASQVWLLKSDGSAIPPQSKPVKGIGIGGGGGYTPSDLYEFPAAAATEAVAVVLMVDGQFHVASLAPKAR